MQGQVKAEQEIAATTQHRPSEDITSFLPRFISSIELKVYRKKTKAWPSLQTPNNPLARSLPS